MKKNFKIAVSNVYKEVSCCSAMPFSKLKMKSLHKLSGLLVSTIFY